MFKGHQNLENGRTLHTGDIQDLPLLNELRGGCGGKVDFCLEWSASELNAAWDAQVHVVPMPHFDP